MAKKSLKDKAATLATQMALSYLEKDPDKSIPKLMTWWERVDKSEGNANKQRIIREIVDNPDNNWYRLVRSLWDDLDQEVLKTVFENLIINSFLIGNRVEVEKSEEHDCNVPWAILMDPTSACNLHCTGCWAADYGNKLNMDYDTLNSIIMQGKELGTYMYIYSGGEPVVRKKDIIRLCEEHDDCLFLAFTNGTLIDEEFADEMLRVKNFIPAISIEGFEEATDSRRGEGTYKKVIRAMEILRKKKLLFGASCCYTSTNTDSIASEEFIDALVDWGCKFAWFFTYMPVGVNAVTELIARPDQREQMYYALRGYRKTKSIFTIDFWNDGEYIDGCIAGGRYYLHISANGDIEPCAFIHYSDSNIREKTLLEAYQSPLFQAYRKNQPFNENMLRPCPLLDNVGALTKMVTETDAKSTDLESPEDVHHLSAKTVDAANNWEAVADKLWEKTQAEKKNKFNLNNLTCLLAHKGKTAS
jgi:MoaA/NifB/PqqE/SkfB family radical SAM enzyme